MISLALDFAIFGNGFGMAQPFFDGRFYWLVDTDGGYERDGKRGRFYRWHGWLGAQLFSTQWRHPLAGESRILNGRKYVVFRSSRRWCRVEVSWRLAELDRCKSLDEENALLDTVRKELDRI